jgi:hypothetical protein
VFHLHNGTLARWLAEQGAGHLAELAREVMRQPEREPRINLERFLIGTGLVERPRLSLRPRRINLGHVLSGEVRSQRLRAQKGRGRGYLFGEVRTNVPWLRVDPSLFNGGGLDALITADTETLSIMQRPWQAEIQVDSSASEDPVVVPVRVRVVAMPSALDRRLLRPLAGAVVASLLGAGLGWAMGHWGAAPPTWFEDWSRGLVAWPVAAAALLGVFWAILGGFRGWKQPLSWPISYATGRWLARMLVWGVALMLLAAASHWAWQQLEPGFGLSLSGPSLTSLVLTALAFAVVPSVLGEIGAARHAEDAIRRPRWRSMLRPLLLAGAGTGFVLVLVAVLLLAGPMWRQFDMEARMSTAGAWAGERWADLEERTEGLMDQLILRYYDRRAPAQPTAVPTAGPATPPTSGSQLP